MSDARTHRIIPAVWVIITNERDELFLLQRANTGWQDGTYCTPSGHVEYMESPRQAAIRELKEEAGIDAIADDLEFAHIVFNKSNDDTDTERTNVFFRLRTYIGEPYLAEPHKASDAGWFAPDALPELTKTLRHAVERMEAGELYSELYY